MDANGHEFLRRENRENWDRMKQCREKAQTYKTGNGGNPRFKKKPGKLIHRGDAEGKTKF